MSEQELGDNQNQNISQQTLILVGRQTEALESIAKTLAYLAKCMSADGKFQTDVSGLITVRQLQ